MKIGEHGRRTAEEVRFDKALGAAIRQRRQAIGMSQSALGDAIDQSFQQIQKYETGANSVKVCRLASIAKALKTTPATLTAQASGDFGDAAPIDDVGTTTIMMRHYAAAPPQIRKAVIALLAAARGDEE